MCEQNTLSKLYGNLLQTSSLWHRAARGTTRSARDPSGTTRLRTCPQDDIVFLAGGFAPCTPIRNCEHSCLTIIVQFDILFFHKQVCQQSGPPACGRVGWVFIYSNEDFFAWQRVKERKPPPSGEVLLLPNSRRGVVCLKRRGVSRSAERDLRNFLRKVP